MINAIIIVKQILIVILVKIAIIKEQPWWLCRTSRRRRRLPQQRLQSNQGEPALVPDRLRRSDAPLARLLSAGTILAAPRSSRGPSSHPQRQGLACQGVTARRGPGSHRGPGSQPRRAGELPEAGAAAPSRARPALEPILAWMPRLRSSPGA